MSYKTISISITIALVLIIMSAYATNEENILTTDISYYIDSFIDDELLRSFTQKGYSIDEIQPFCYRIETITDDGKELYALYSIESQYFSDFIYYEAYASDQENGLILTVNMDYMYEFVPCDREPQTHCLYDFALPFRNERAWIEKGNICGYIDANQDLIITPQEGIWTKSDSFSDGYAVVVSEENQYGYIDINGQIVITPQYAWADDFHSGRAVVLIQDQGYSFINKDNELINGEFYDAANPYHHEYASVRKNGCWNYINLEGEYVTNGEYKTVLPANDDHTAWVSYEDDQSGIHQKFVLISLINNEILSKSYYYVWEDDPFPVSSGFYIVRSDMGKGVIDNHGIEIIRPVFRLLYFTSDGAIIVKP